MSRINELNDELQAVRNQKSYLIRHGAENTDQGVTDLEEREAEIFRMISEEETRLANQVIEEEYGSNDKPYIIKVGVTEFYLHDYVEKSDNHRVLAIALSRRDLENQTIIKRMEESLETERKQFREQQSNADAAADAKYNELYEQAQAWRMDSMTLAVEREENRNTKLERDDFERKLQAATSEIESLKQQLEAASNRVEAPVQTNLDGNLAEAMRKANEAKRAIYNVVKDAANINYTAQYVDNDETFSDKVIYIGKYRQLSDEEAKRFQQEIEQAKQAELESTPEAEIPVELVEEQFRTELELPVLTDAHGTGGVEEYGVEREGLSDGTGGVASVEERLTALELAVFGQVRAAA
jgi:hypothetical protein